MIIYCKECGKAYDKMEECILIGIVSKTIQYPLPDLKKGNYEREIFCPCYICPKRHKIEVW